MMLDLLMVSFGRGVSVVAPVMGSAGVPTALRSFVRMLEIAAKKIS